ncbi:hypothetical protein G4X40_06605 [Rhodococcus sp. D2-41]|uniref:Anti-sigma-M factor RsmA n=1 Tax=Speluncibacter jeojiensis TaxID=2710754 RepID=A0A9X4M0I0_9ACTN|nr:hypothetical protein [Rhodococcus sp. D2-41]MDG3009816.1 hypothetical protein [Rhodococcus sp. D2-41]MDG3014567.1 hypothetical protein [Corynebacteriales bacterium D3-21]
MSERPDLLGLEPPFPAELLADLHAGVLPDDVADRLWPQVHADPAAEQVIGALDTVAADLHRLGADETGPAPEPIPTEVAARIQRALLDEPIRPAVTDIRSRRRRRVLAGGAVAAAVAAVLAVVVGIDHSRSPNPVVAAPPVSIKPAGNTVDLGNDLSAAGALRFRGEADLGRLTDPAARGECLRANGLSPDAPVLGSASVLIRGVHGTLLLLPGPRPPALTALVVGDRCGQSGTTDALAVKQIGGP